MPCSSPPIAIVLLAAFIAAGAVADEAATGADRRQWITQLFARAGGRLAADERASRRCRHDLRVYAAHLANQTVWAVRMLESSAWPALGLLSGVTTHLGNWAECLEANGGGVSGQYCLVQTRLGYSWRPDQAADDRHSDQPEPFNDASAWRVVQKFERNPIYLSRLKLSWALCVPSSCSPDDIVKCLDATLAPIFEQSGLSITAHVESDLCSVSSELAWPPEFYRLTLCVGVLFVSVTSISAYYALNSGGTRESESAVLRRFSLEYILKKLVRRRAPARYNPLYMLKAVAIVLVIGGHIVMLETQAAVFQTEQFEKLFFKYHGLDALDSCVDLYSTISGFLTLHMDLEVARRRGAPFVVLKVLSQWAKLSALIGLHVLFAINVWPYLGQGPLWKKVIFSEAAKCSRNWPSNILATANLYPPENSCLLHTWYLSVHTQISILGGILLYAFSKSERIGIAASAAVFLGGVLRTCFLVYQHEYNSIFLGYMKTLNNLQREKDFVLYIATSPRIGPYVLGFAAALCARKLRRSKSSFSKLRMAAAVAASGCVALYVAHYRRRFNVDGRPYDALENAVYACLSRSFLILPVACALSFYYASLYTAKSAINGLCQHKVWVPIGRLVPNVYLLHCPLVLSVIMSRRTYSPNANELDIFWQLAAAVYYSFTMAFFWFLFVQTPLVNAAQLIFEKLSGLYRSLRKKKGESKKC